MAFDSAAAYGEFMGRYAAPLAIAFADLAAVAPGQRVLDVGCGPGTLTSELVRRVGAGQVGAIDPSAPFVAATTRDHPGVDVRQGFAEALPYADGVFDAVLAQLVVHFMKDAVAGLTEMRRVAAPGAVVAACVWDYQNQRGPLSPFWRAARELDPGVDDESGLAGVGEGALVDLFTHAGMPGARSGALTVRVTLPDFEDYWRPFTLGVGPAGDYVRTRTPEQFDRLHEACRRQFPDGPVTVTGVAWTAVWRAP